MNMHKNARLTPRSREVLVNRVIDHGQPVSEVAQAMGVSVRTVYKWVARYRAEGIAGLADRSSRPARSPHATGTPIRARVIDLRRERRTFRQIAQETGISLSTVGRILRRAGISRLRDLEPAPPVVRYERETPGELLHLDVKKLGRFRQPGHRVTGNRRMDSAGAGWEFVHVAVDDASRVAFTQVRPDEKATSAWRFLIDAVRYYRSLGIKITGVMTDNGSCYKKKFNRACRRLGIKHIYTRPYTPRTNGKAERFIQTALREWAYARSYACSEQRKQFLPAWTHQYNWHRPHASLGYQPPISRISKTVNNLLALHS
jgi:transposase InsO family protein